MDTYASSSVDAGMSPFIVEYIMVLCAGIRHMAYRDRSGNWRDAYENSELRGPVMVLW